MAAKVQTNGLLSTYLIDLIISSSFLASRQGRPLKLLNLLSGS